MILQFTEVSAEKIFRFFFSTTYGETALALFIPSPWFMLFVFYSVSNKTMQLSYVLIRVWTSESSLSSPSWYRVKTHRGSRELGCRWFSCFCWPIISWEYPVYFHRPARAKRVSDQDQTVAAAVNETQYVVRSEEMLVDRAGLPKPHTFLWTFRHKHLTSTLPTVFIYWCLLQAWPQAEHFLDWKKSNNCSDWLRRSRTARKLCAFLLLVCV